MRAVGLVLCVSVACGCTEPGPEVSSVSSPVTSAVSDVGPTRQHVLEGVSPRWGGAIRVPGDEVPVSITWDFHDDGAVDAVVCDDDAGTSAPECAGQTAMFANEQLFSDPTLTGQSLREVEDLDGDGNVDAVAVVGSDVWVLRGNGRGGLLGPERFHTTETIGTDSVSVGDVTGDGDPDLCVAQTGGLFVLAGDGQGSFVPLATASITGLSSNSMLGLADLDGDGDEDVVATLSFASGEYGTYVMTSNGDGTFAASQLVSTKYGFALGDLDGDGDVDVVANNGFAGSVVDVHANDGAGAFAAAVTLPGTSGTTRVVALDVDGDAFDDLVTFKYGTHTVWYGAAALASISGLSNIVIPAGGDDAQTGDLSGDGLADLVIRHSDTNYLYVQTAARTFQAAGAFSAYRFEIGPLGGGAASVITGDNGVLGARRRVGNAVGAAHTFASDTANFGGVTADFNEDGIPDFAGIYPSTISLALSTTTGGGTWTATTVSIPSAATLIAAGDVDGDNNADLAITLSSYPSYLFLRKGDGAGGFAAGVYVSLPSNTTNALAVGDFDGDGDGDVIRGASSGSYCRNDGASFTCSGGASGAKGFSVSDYDADGKDDVVVMTTVAALLRGTTSGLASTGLSVPCGVDYLPTCTDAAVGDFDGDDVIDLATCGDDFYLYPDLLRIGWGGGTITTEVGTCPPYGKLAAGDLDNDGDDDLVLSEAANYNAGRAVTAYLGGSRSPQATIPTRGPFSVAVVQDVTGDGRREIVGAAYGTVTRISTAPTSLVVPVDTTAPGTPSLGAHTARLAVTTSAGAMTVPYAWDVAESHLDATVVAATGTERAPATLRAWVQSNPIDVVTSCVWNFGDGTTASDPACSAGATSTISLAMPHTYADGDPTTYPVSLTITDADETITRAGSAVIADAAPTATVGWDGDVVEGVPEAFQVTFADGDDAYWRAQFGFDGALDQSATLSTAGTATLVTRTWNEEHLNPQSSGGPYLLVELTGQCDAAGAACTGEASYAYAYIPVIDHAAEIGTITTTALVEGQAITFAANVSGVPADRLATCVWSFGDGTAPVSDGACASAAQVTSQVTHTFADGEPSDRTITLTVTDEDSTTTRTLPVVIANVAPSVTITSITGGAVEGSAVEVHASIADAAGALDAPFALTWDFGDGTVEHEVLSGAGSRTRSHVYGDDDTYTISVSATDQVDLFGTPAAGALTGSATAPVTVGNLPPVVAAIPSPQTATEGIVFLYQAVATDPGVDALAFSLVSGPAGMLVTSTGAIGWSPTYAQTGAPPPGRSFDVTIQVSDGDGGTDDVSFSIGAVWKDDDGDAMADTWELAHGLDPTQDDAAEDPDGDGVTNLEEFEAAPPPGPRAPGPPVAIAPADLAEVETPDVAIELGDAAEGDNAIATYEVQLGDALPVFPTSATAPAGTGGTTTVVIDGALAGLEDDSMLWWRARAIDDTGLPGSWTTPRSFRYDPVNDAPNAPVMQSPDDGTAVSSSRPLLTAIGAGDVDDDEVTYVFTVSTSSTLTPAVAISPELVAGAFGSLTWQVDVWLDENVVYWWRVDAADPRGGVSSSSLGRFRVDASTQPPSAPVLLSPDEGEIVTDGEATLVATGAIDGESGLAAGSYDFELDTAFTFNTPARQGITGEPVGIDGNAIWTSGALEEDVTYYWRARAGIGEWSVASFFASATDDPPSVPVPLSPSPGAIVAATPPTLMVANAVDPERGDVRYRFELRDASDEVVETIEDVDAGDGERTTVTLTAALAAGATYTWRVQAEDAAGNTSNWSTPSAFVVDAAGDGGCSTGGGGTTLPFALLIALVLSRARRRDHGHRARAR